MYKRQINVFVYKSHNLETGRAKTPFSFGSKNILMAKAIDKAKQECLSRAEYNIYCLRKIYYFQYLSAGIESPVLRFFLKMLQNLLLFLADIRIVRHIAGENFIFFVQEFVQILYSNFFKSPLIFSTLLQTAMKFNQTL